MKVLILRGLKSKHYSYLQCMHIEGWKHVYHKCTSVCCWTSAGIVCGCNTPSVRMRKSTSVCVLEMITQYMEILTNLVIFPFVQALLLLIVWCLPVNLSKYKINKNSWNVKTCKNVFLAKQLPALGCGAKLYQLVFVNNSHITLLCTSWNTEKQNLNSQEERIYKWLKKVIFKNKMH